MSLRTDEYLRDSPGIKRTCSNCERHSLLGTISYVQLASIDSAALGGIQLFLLRTTSDSIHVQLSGENNCGLLCELKPSSLFGSGNHIREARSPHATEQNHRHTYQNERHL